MRFFVLGFLAFYALVHYYLYRKLSQAFDLGLRVRLFTALLLSLATISPVLWRVLDKKGVVEISRPLALIGLLWMGFVIYFFLVGLAVDLYRRFHSPGPRRAFFITLFLSLLLSLYSHAETHYLQVYRFTLETSKLPPGIEVKILHISDMHLGPVMREDRIEMLEGVYEKERPDIIVATGDMVDGNMKGLEHLAKRLAKIDPPLGKFAVLGNHEFYVGHEQAIGFLEMSGFRVLRGEGVEVGEFLNIVGVDDPAGERLGYKVITDEVSVLKSVDTSRYTILIKHRPEVEKEALPYLDLVLAGHTHGGVLFFVGYTVLRLMFETDRGLKEIAPGKFIAVSKGLGTGGPPMRLLSPPDVMVITIRGRYLRSSPSMSPPLLSLRHSYELRSALPVAPRPSRWPFPFREGR